MAGNFRTDCAVYWQLREDAFELARTRTLDEDAGTCVRDLADHRSYYNFYGPAPLWMIFCFYLIAAGKKKKKAGNETK